MKLLTVLKCRACGTPMRHEDGRYRCTACGAEVVLDAAGEEVWRTAALERERPEVAER